ncbi:uncharacterized protein CCDC198 [Bombina bombina]|uniref:uncharacterized protein CCDC198 n=1 Tax=Bombina bombina TaxID=8345 RepID=UPI00235AE0AF|nr:uncharacterized protein CCDC198 [Bombina bombina]
MGVNQSKCNHKVRKVMPLEGEDVLVSSVIIHGHKGMSNLSSFGRMKQTSPTWDGHLPPLRETLYGRGSTDPRPICFDIPLEDGDKTSIIKRHPPRRLQKLDPIQLPTLTAQGIISKHEAATAGKGMEMDKTIQTTKPYSVNRQHDHKTQMQEINRKREAMNRLQSQAEIKRLAQREAMINKSKARELKAKKVRENAQKRNEDFNEVENDKTYNMDHGDTWNWNVSNSHISNHLQGNGKLEMWFKETPNSRDSFCDSSSSDSLDKWIQEEGKGHRRPPLIRTKTEKIPTFDEFFDRDF